MVRKIETRNWSCDCGSSKFYFQGYGSDGCCETWVEASCQNCGKNYEIWDGTDYEFYLTEEDKQHIVESTLKSTRATMALEGITISDANFEKIKSIVIEFK